MGTLCGDRKHTSAISDRKFCSCRHIRAALERIIERASEVDVTASAVVAAVQAYSKIDAAGQWIERTEQVSLNDLFDRMSTQELEEYAQKGTLPKWFESAAS